MDWWLQRWAPNLHRKGLSLKFDKGWTWGFKGITFSSKGLYTFTLKCQARWHVVAMYWWSASDWQCMLDLCHHKISATPNATSFCRISYGVENSNTNDECWNTSTFNCAIATLHLVLVSLLKTCQKTPQERNYMLCIVYFELPCMDVWYRACNLEWGKPHMLNYG